MEGKHREGTKRVSPQRRNQVKKVRTETDKGQDKHKDEADMEDREQSIYSEYNLI
jgi:hypothetical protein